MTETANGDGFWFNHVYIEDNKISGYSSGITGFNLLDSVVRDNEIDNCSYGIRITNIDGNVFGNKISNTKWAGVSCEPNYTNTSRIINNLIFNGEQKGMLLKNPQGTSIIDINNNTIVNHAYYGIYADNASQTVSNCIVWNSGDDLYGCSATYSCIEDGDAGTGNISSDPRFVDADNNDFHIEVDSPCLDAGDPNGDYANEVDIDGDARVLDSYVDIGADEVNFPFPDAHWWKLDETSGIIAYDYIDNNDGIFNGNDPCWVNGFIGGAADFDGASDYFAVTSLDVDSSSFTNAFSVAGWFKTSQTSGIQTIVGNWSQWDIGTYDIWSGWQVVVESNKVVSRFGPSDPFVNDITGTTNVADNNWHHFAVVYAGGSSNAILYVDGSSEGTPLNPGAYLYYSKFRIGDGSYVHGGDPVMKGGPFCGTIDDVMIFNGVLSAEEVEQLYREGLSEKATNPNPANLATGVSVNADISWTAGARAESHDVYFGTSNPPTFIQNQTQTTYDPGTLDNGTTYYWRIDEKNSVGTTTGNIWSFTTIYTRVLTCSSTDDGNVTTPGEGQFSYDHGTDANIVATADTDYHFVNWTGSAVDAGKVTNPNSASTTVLMDANYTVIANFAIDPPGQATNPSPANSAADVNINADLSWTAGARAETHDVYFGTTNPPTFIQNQTQTTYDPGTLAYSTTYYWRIDEKNDSGTTAGDVWSFTTAPPPVSILGSWVTGTTHVKESGADRALVFIAHAEDNDNPTITLNSVTYGGQQMTKVIESVYATGYWWSQTRAYVAAFILDEAGVNAASGNTFTVMWNQPPDYNAYSSVFLQDVNQTTLIGATASNGGTSDPITTAALSTVAGDMVIDAATCGNAGSYTMNNGFTEGTDQQIGSPATATGATGYKSATGADETPKADYSDTMNRQVLIGLVVRSQ